MVQPERLAGFLLVLVLFLHIAMCICTYTMYYMPR